jgi:hypothetical protein
LDVFDGVQGLLWRCLGPSPSLSLALSDPAIPLIELDPHPAPIAKVLMKAIVKE